jgi:diguanylate cyclase (GGDEF)-like protein
VQREIDRANRGNGRLIVVYVDVNGLKAANDSEGHHAGDVILKHMVNVVQNLCSYGSVVRLGDDQCVCTISDTTIENVRERCDEITAQLSLTPDDGSISVGFAQLVRGDSPLDLIDRADRGLIASRGHPKSQSSDRDLTQLSLSLSLSLERDQHRFGQITPIFRDRQRVVRLDHHSG